VHGVFHHSERKLKKPFSARLKVNKKPIYLGYSETAEEAQLAYAKAAEKHFGEFADIHLRATGTANEEARG
jgi:hypothetical protein